MSRRFHLTQEDLRPFIGRRVSMNRRDPSGFMYVVDGLLLDVEEDFIHWIPEGTMDRMTSGIRDFERVEERIR